MTDQAPKPKLARKKSTAKKVAANERPRADRHVNKSGTSKVYGTRLNHCNLTPEQEAYCRARAMGMSRKEAVTAAGLSVTMRTVNAWESPSGVHGTKITERINQLSSIATHNAILKTGLDREWVISRLMTVAERCMQAEPVLDSKGEPTGEYKFDSMGANQALRMLGDTMSLFKPKEKSPEDEFAALSDDELARLTQELAAQTGLVEALAREAAPPEHQQAGTLQALPAPD